MRPHHRFHLIALSCICVVIVVLYYLMAPNKSALTAANPTSNHVIEIQSATWGANCNPYIDQALAERATAPIVKDKDGKPIPLPKLTKAETDNVLTIVSKVCNGQVACQITPTTTNMAFDPMPGCYKILNVNYRCFSYDPLSHLNIDQGKPSTIDCSNENAAAKTTTPAAN